MISLPNVDAFKKKFRDSKHILIVAGAGLSAASGIPTFRNGGGMALEAKPNAAHEILAKISVRELLKKTDALQALLDRITSESQANSEIPSHKSVFPNPVIEMHGSTFDVKCTQCNNCVEDRSNPLCAALGAADEAFKNYHEAGSKDINIPVEDLPRCSVCNALARPGVVWFGEVPYHLKEIEYPIVHKADMCLVIGTSSTVYPAAGYAAQVQEHGGAVAVINLEPNEEDEQEADFIFRGPCEKILPALFPELAD